MIIDSLRIDCISEEITPNLIELSKEGTLKTIYAVNNNTEPCLVAIFTGVHPLDSGLVGLGQRDAYRILSRILTPKDWVVYSSAILFEPFFKFKRCRYLKQINLDKLKRFKGLVIVHTMECHDYYCDDERWLDFYRGYEPIPEERTLVDLSKAFGWGKPWESIVKTNDAGELKARYLGALNKIDEWVDRIREIFDVIIVTADHGELWGENGVVFRHQTLHDLIVKVPLISNIEIDADDQTEILYPKKPKEYIVSTENTWQSGIRVDVDGKSLTHYWNKIYNLPNWVGDMDLKPFVLQEKKRFPKRLPTLIEGQDLRFFLSN